MANPIALATLAALLLAAPASATLAASAPLSATPLGVPSAVHDTGAIDLAGASPTALTEVQGLEVPGLPASAELADLLQCRQAVQVDRLWSTGVITDRRESHEKFLEDKVLDIVTLHHIPILETVTKTLWEPTGLLAGLAAPVTQTVTQVTGFSLEEVHDSVVVPVAIEVSWQDQYVDWTTHHDTVLLALVSGLPLVADGTGVLVKVCDPEVPLLPSVPQPGLEGADYLCICLNVQDGWETHLEFVDAHPASAEEQATLPHGCGVIIVEMPALVVQAIDQAVAELNGLPSSQLPGAAEPDEEEADGEATQADVGTQSSGLVHIPPSTVALALLAAVAMASLALAGTVAWRRLR